MEFELLNFIGGQALFIIYTSYPIAIGSKFLSKQKLLNINIYVFVVVMSEIHNSTPTKLFVCSKTHE